MILLINYINEKSIKLSKKQEEWVDRNQNKATIQIWSREIGSEKDVWKMGAEKT